MSESTAPTQTFQARVTEIFEQVRAQADYKANLSLILKENSSAITTAAHPVSGDVIFFVGKGYADKLNNESLAFVLAHELGHAALNHATVLTELDKAHGLQPGQKTKEDLDSKAIEAYSQISKQTEFEADAYAFKIVQGMGLDIDKATVSLKELGDTSSITHPTGKERLQAIDVLQASPIGKLEIIEQQALKQTAMGIRETPSAIYTEVQSAALVKDASGADKVLCANCIAHFDKENNNAVYRSELKEITAQSEITLNTQIASQSATEPQFLQTVSQSVSEISNQLSEKTQSLSASHQKPTAPSMDREF